MSDDMIRRHNSTLSVSRTRLRNWRDKGRGSLDRSTGLEGSTPIKPVNRDRKKKRADEGVVYGPYHRHLASRPCIVSYYVQGECMGEVAGHHLKTVAAGGQDADNEVPLCVKHHTEIHASLEKFEARYEGMDVDIHAADEWGRYCDEHPEIS